MSFFDRFEMHIMTAIASIGFAVVILDLLVFKRAESNLEVCQRASMFSQPCLNFPH